MSNVTLSNKHEELLGVLQARFEKSMNRHQGLEWAKVQATLEANAEKLRSLHEMEALAVTQMLLVMTRRRANTFFMIVPRRVRKSAEVFATTVKRWTQGKKNKPKGDALDLAAAIGVELLTEEQYRELLTLGEFDAKTSSS